MWLLAAIPPPPPPPPPTELRAKIDAQGEISFRTAFIDPLQEEMRLNVPREEVGPSYAWHSTSEHLQVSLQGQHRSYRTATRDAAKHGIDAEELFKIGAALSAPAVTLEDLVLMRKRLADDVVIWQTGKQSDRHGMGKNLLPAYDISNEHVTLANTIKVVTGAKFRGSAAELSTLDKVLLEYGKIAEVIRQMYAVRMSAQAFSLDNVNRCISAACEDVEHASEERRDLLLEAQSDVAFVSAQVMALSGLFKALFLALPGIMSSRVLPPAAPKEVARETSSLVSAGELRRLRTQADLRASYAVEAAPSSAAASAKKKERSGAAAAAKPKAKAKNRRSTGSAHDSPYSRSKSPVSSRLSTTPASGGADKQADSSSQSLSPSRTRKKNDKKRAKTKDRKKRAAEDDPQSNAPDAASSAPTGGTRSGSEPPDKGSHGRSPSSSGNKQKHKKKHKGN